MLNNCMLKHRITNNFSAIDLCHVIHTNVCKIIRFCGAISSFFSKDRLSNSDILLSSRWSFQRCQWIFIIWPTSSLKILWQRIMQKSATGHLLWCFRILSLYGWKWIFQASYVYLHSNNWYLTLFCINLSSLN